VISVSNGTDVMIDVTDFIVMKKALSTLVKPHKVSLKSESGYL